MNEKHSESEASLFGYEEDVKGFAFIFFVDEIVLERSVRRICHGS
jgi:hypothetical protein